MGNGTSIPGGVDPNTYEGDDAAVARGLHGKPERLSNEAFYCCLSTGNAYRRSPDPRDLNTEAGILEFKHAVRPTQLHGDWLKVADDKWLPLTFFWGPKSSGGEPAELMKLYDGKQEVINPVTGKAYSKGWNIVDNTVQSVLLNDAVEDAVDQLEMLRLKAVQRIQAAERGRQARKKRAKKKKKKRLAELKAKEEEIAKLKGKLAKKEKKKEEKAQAKAAADADRRQREKEKEEQLKAAMAKKNALGHATLSPLKVQSEGTSPAGERQQGQTDTAA